MAKSAGLLEEIRSAQKSAAAGGSRCSTGILLGSLPESDRTELEEAFADQSLRTTTMVRVLRERGAQVSYDSMKRHRAGDCRCAGD